MSLCATFPSDSKRALSGLLTIYINLYITHITYFFLFWISLLIKVHMAQKAHKIVGVHKDSTLAQLFAAVPVPAMLKAKDYAGTTIECS